MIPRVDLPLANYYGRENLMRFDSMASWMIFGARCSPQALYVAAIKSPKVRLLVSVWLNEFLVL